MLSAKHTSGPSDSLGEFFFCFSTLLAGSTLPLDLFFFNLKCPLASSVEVASTLVSPLSLAEKGAQQEGSGGFAMEGCGGRLEQAGRATCYFYMLFLLRGAGKREEDAWPELKKNRMLKATNSLLTSNPIFHKVPAAAEAVALSSRPQDQ